MSPQLTQLIANGCIALLVILPILYIVLQIILRVGSMIRFRVSQTESSLSFPLVNHLNSMRWLLVLMGIGLIVNGIEQWRVYSLTWWYIFLGISGCFFILIGGLFVFGSLIPQTEESSGCIVCVLMFVCAGLLWILSSLTF